MSVVLLSVLLCRCQWCCRCCGFAVMLVVCCRVLSSWCCGDVRVGGGVVGGVSGLLLPVLSCRCQWLLSVLSRWCQWCCRCCGFAVMLVILLSVLW